MSKVTLRTLLDACDERKTDILARVEAMGDAARNARPALGEWSPHEIIAHLVVTEELFGWTDRSGGAPIRKRPAQARRQGRAVCRADRRADALGKTPARAGYLRA